MVSGRNSLQLDLLLSLHKKIIRKTLLPRPGLIINACFLQYLDFDWSAVKRRLQALKIKRKVNQLRKSDPLLQTQVEESHPLSQPLQDLLLLLLLNDLPPSASASSFVIFCIFVFRITLVGPCISIFVDFYIATCKLIYCSFCRIDKLIFSFYSSFCFPSSYSFVYAFVALLNSYS